MVQGSAGCDRSEAEPESGTRQSVATTRQSVAGGAGSEAGLLARVETHLEAANFSGYVDLLQRPKRMIVQNFVSGLARGVGIGLGFTLLAAAFVIVFTKLSLLNLPVIGGYIADIVRIVQAQLHTPTM